MKPIASLLAALALAASLSAQTLQPFASFAEKGKEYPESIARDPDGNLYLSLTFARSIKKVSADGAVSDFVSIPDNWLLGLTFDPAGNLVAAGADGIWKVTPSGLVWKFSTVPGRQSLNDLAYHPNGDLFVTDDTLFAIWKVDAYGQATLWSQDPALAASNPTFPFLVGANGIAFSRDGKTMYVTNTSEGRLIAIDLLANNAPGNVRVIAAGPELIGIDAVRVDQAGNLIVAQNIRREILKVTPAGQVSTLVSGSPLSFPTSLVAGPAPRTFYICNNGDAFFSNKPSGQGVLLLDLR